jgi:perosamine synthetase
MSKPIFLDAPNVGEAEKKYLNQAIDTGEVSTIGSFVPRFENALAEYLGVKKAVSVQSGTAAIEMALYEAGIKEGDGVIVPALTFAATVNPVIYGGAVPVFADVDPETWNISPEEIKKAITEKTKAIIPVHLYGNPCHMDEITKIAEEHNLIVIEDATESLGARFNGKYTGTFGDFGCFSFNGNKVITTGGGGLIVSGDEKKAEHIRFLVNQGRDESKGYYHPELGFNYRMTNIEAAIGLGQMEKLNGFLALKAEFRRIYEEELGNNNSISFQKTLAGASSSNWLCCLKFNGDTDVAEIQKKLRENNIPSRRIFMPVTEFPYLKAFPKPALKNSYAIYDKGLCLPSSTLNTPEDIYYVCQILKKVI